MGEWKEYSLLDFAEIHNQTRIPLSKMERAERQGVYPYYGASGIIDYVDDFLFDGEFVLISEDGENLKSRQTPIAFKAAGKFWVNNHAHILKGKKGFHNNLIIYYFKNLDLNPYITGAVQPKLNKANLLSIPIILPDNETEQKAIASVLSSLDDKIDLLHRQNKTLEAMAETLFRQWFVEEAQEDWEVVKLDSLINISSGKGLKKEHLAESGAYPVLGANGEIGRTNEFLFNESLLFTGRVGTLGNIFRVENEKVWLSDNTLVIKPKNYFNFIYFVLKTAKLEEYNVGSTQPLIRQSDIKEIEINLPSENKLHEFEKESDLLLNKIRQNKSQVCTIEKLRNTLLPKLMSGEVRVQYDKEATI